MEDTIVSRRFNSGFVILSYMISYIGSLTTLELISRRTSTSGLSNWLLLGAASVSMGGIATWCMHFIGNQAIILANGDTSAQVKYNLGLTASSFVLPITMAFLAFATVGSDVSSVARVIMGGVLNSFGILGMHYLAQAGISNYQCSYKLFWIIGAFIISFLACVTGLSQFFLFRLAWESSFWKRAACAFMISAGISAVHWLSSIGTIYRLQVADFKPMDKNYQIITITLISLLSILGCFILLALGILSQRRKKKSTRTAQQLVLAIATFDQENKILVTPAGSLPLRKITNSWLERTPYDEFNISHPIFLWMFGTSRNWTTVVNMIPAMRSHIKTLHSKRFRGLHDILMSEEGIPIHEYSLVFEELFCIKAADLANDLGQPLERIGVLFDEIINTEQIPIVKDRMETTEVNSLVDLESEAMALRITGKGQIIFLVNRVQLNEAQQLKAAGYRFASIEQVVSILAISLQVKRKTLTYYIKMMQNYSSYDYLPEPGLYFSIFAMRASTAMTHRGFEILARRDAKTQLPSMKIDIHDTKDWHFEYLKTMKNMTMIQCIHHLSQATGSKDNSYSTRKFVQNLLTSLETLRDKMKDTVFDDSLTSAEPFEMPCARKKKSGQEKAFHVVFRIFLPIHKNSPIDKLVFVPLDFFKTAQQHDKYFIDSLNNASRDENYSTTTLSPKRYLSTNDPKEESSVLSQEILGSKGKTENSEQNIGDSRGKIISMHPLSFYQAQVDGALKEMKSFVDELFEATISMRQFQNSQLRSTKGHFQLDKI